MIHSISELLHFYIFPPHKLNFAKLPLLIKHDAAIYDIALNTHLVFIKQTL